MRRRSTLTSVAAALLGTDPARAQPGSPLASPPARGSGRRGIPGARNLDHVGLVVPDLEQAVRFFVDLLGAEELFRFDEGPGTENPADLHQVFDVDPRSRLRIAMLRLGPTVNIELLEYAAPEQRREMPRNSDVDAPHLAFWVEDMDVAAAYLAAHGCTLLGGPFTSKDGPKAGQSIRYARTPWGLSIEILHRPAHMPYEQGTVARLFGPAASWSNAP
ncbi:MAG: VOC family protein [Acetobacteraceae bacterium]|nr:VOC family protein [Acetobacteraceae bacterium]